MVYIRIQLMITPDDGAADAVMFPLQPRLAFQPGLFIQLSGAYYQTDEMMMMLMIMA